MKLVTIKTTYNNILKALPSYSELSVAIGDSNLLVTGAKARHKGGGWWTISGYASNGNDVTKALNLINN